MADAASTVKACDRIDNLRSLPLGDKAFVQKQLEETLKYIDFMKGHTFDTVYWKKAFELLQANFDAVKVLL